MHPNILNDVTFKDIETENYKFFTNASEDKIILFKNIGKGFAIGDSYNYISFYATEVEKIYSESILVLGLGSGLIPYYLSSRCKQIDVLEIDAELIEIIIWQNYLPSNINLIEGDAFKFTTTKKWDYIICDIFSGHETYNVEKTEILISKYTNYLNDNGYLYIPFQQKIITPKIWQV